MPKLVLGRDGHGVLDDGLHSEGRDGWVLERGAQGPWREFCINTDYLSIFSEKTLGTVCLSVALGASGAVSAVADGCW